MLTLFATATAVLALLAIYQERKYRFFHEFTLTIFREVCHKWDPTEPVFTKRREKAKTLDKNC